MLTIKNLSAGYGKVQVLHGISLEVPKGQVVTLIGSNGAGKTTTMRAVSGMIKPTGGEITLNERRIDGLESYHIARRGLAHSPEGRRVFATMTVTDNLRLGAFRSLHQPGAGAGGDIALQFHADRGGNGHVQRFEGQVETAAQLESTARQHRGNAGQEQGGKPLGFARRAGQDA